MILHIFILLISSLAVWKGGSLLESSAETLSRHYHLPPIVQGSIITAVGSSFPELSTTIISTMLHGEFDLGVSVIIGSAIFNILVIPGLSVIVAGQLDSDRILVYKDAQFYIISVAVLLLAFSMAVIYNPVEGPSIRGNMTRLIAAVPLCLYLLYLFLQSQETMDFKKDPGNVKIVIQSIWKEWARLLLSLILIVFSVEGLVRGAIFMGDYFRTPNFIWGVTVLAAVTSVPDAVVSVKVAIHKNSMVSLANVLGSNIFDLLVAVPAGVIIAGSSVVDFSVAVPMMLFLTIATILLFTFLRTGLRLTKGEGWILMLCYALFVLWMILESVGLMSYVVG